MNTAGTQTGLENATGEEPAAVNREPQKRAFVPEKDVGSPQSKQQGILGD